MLSNDSESARHCCWLVMIPLCRRRRRKWPGHAVHCCNPAAQPTHSVLSYTPQTPRSVMNQMNPTHAIVVEDKRKFVTSSKTGGMATATLRAVPQWQHCGTISNQTSTAAVMKSESVSHGLICKRKIIKTTVLHQADESEVLLRRRGPVVLCVTTSRINQSVVPSY